MLRLKLLMLSGLFMATTANATIDIVLTKGNPKAVPVGVAQFAGQANLSQQPNIAAIINNDLLNSGDIKPTLAEDANADTGYWRGQGADDVVSGSIAAAGDNYNVAFKLDNLFSSSQDSGKLDSRVLANQSFTVDGSQLRDLAHHISDQIYQKLTGYPGVASTKLAYVVMTDNNNQRQYKLEVADADGLDSHTILASREPIMSPVWSPNGDSIAYVSFENHRARLYMQNISTGQRQIISKAKGINNAPAFSKDGGQMALVLSKSGSPKIYLLNLASGKLRQLTQGSSIDTEPNWMPDGKAILFTSNRGGTPQVYRKDIASGQVTRLTYNGNYNARPRVLPDGSGFVMMHRESGMFGIAKQDFADGRMTILTNEGGDESPSLSPNGRQIIYATQFGGRGILAIVSIDGSFKMRLPARDGNVQEPAWSPIVGRA